MHTAIRLQPLVSMIAMKHKVFLLALCLACLPGSFDSGIVALSDVWTSYRGYLTYNQAVQSCLSVQALLPTIDQIKQHHARGGTEHWTQKVGDSFYWTRTVDYDDAERYLIFDPVSGLTSSSLPLAENNVRCRK